MNLFSTSNVFGQMIVQNDLSFDYLCKRWEDYQKEAQYDLPKFSRLYFKDTISVKEMKEAFFIYKDTRFDKSPYEGLDSIKRMGSIGESVMLLSPLRNHPNKKVRECRGVWTHLLALTGLLDKNGVSQDALLKKIKDEDMKKCMDDAIVTLRSPHWYMGYIVSPVVNMDVFSDGKRKVRTPNVSYSDFFAYANRYHIIFDGEWYQHVDGGARLLGSLQGLNTMSHANVSETEFSVLLYAKTSPRSNKVTYTIDLLLPKNPDNGIVELFNDLKSFIERLPACSFAPYYTTDMRLMTGRYYRVTVNKCGWLIEDYLK